MLPSSEEIQIALEPLLPGVALTLEGGALLVAPANMGAVCRCLKESERFGLDYLSNLTAVDYLPDATSGGAGAGQTFTNAGAGRIEVIYYLYSMAQKHGPVILHTKLPRANPVVASVTPIWRGAEFQEREVYDLYGVTFEGHPDLRRILMWDGFEGHPMRKDYVVEDQDA